MPIATRREFVVYLSSTLADLEPEQEAALKTIAEFGRVTTSFRASDAHRYLNMEMLREQRKQLQLLDAA